MDPARFPLGPFHRLESPTQTSEDAKAIANTGELFGKAARGSNIPSVKAYRGVLPSAATGIEFWSATPPHPNEHPFLVRWYRYNPGVFQIDDDTVAIKVLVTRSTL